MGATDEYRDIRVAVSTLGRDLTESDADRVVPACPAWTVKHVYCHLAGVVADLLDGRLEDAGSDAWTSAQITARQSRPLAETIDEWERRAPQLEADLAVGDPAMAVGLIGDAVTHEHDIRGGLRRPGRLDSPAFSTALELYVQRLSARLTDSGVGGIRICTADREWLIGEDGAAPTLSVDSFELFRSLTGRRSPRQVAGFNWSTDPAPYLPVWSAYGTLAEEDVTER